VARHCAAQHVAAVALTAALTGLVAVGTAPSASAHGVRLDSSLDAIEDKVGMGVEPPESGQAKEENAELAKLAASAEQAVAEILENAWKLPLAPGAYHLTAGFGECSSLWSHCHTGLDFAAPEGTPILAVANGVIAETGWAGAYGNRTVMTLEDGTDLWYCHQSAIGVEAGDQVVGGQPIGAVGATGNTTGPHLHLEVRPCGGDAVDPFQALTVHGLQP
jgi:murein DD-endopeptidase MepM/ murein hydrolase activator NlpD